jgi:hypothetical protein
LEVFGEAEIGDDAFAGDLVFKQDILRFEIAVHDAFVVHFYQTLEEAADDGLNLFWSEFLF